MRVTFLSWAAADDLEVARIVGLNSWIVGRAIVKGRKEVAHELALDGVEERVETFLRLRGHAVHRTIFE